MFRFSFAFFTYLFLLFSGIFFFPVFPSESLLQTQQSLLKKEVKTSSDPLTPEFESELTELSKVQDQAQNEVDVLWSEIKLWLKKLHNLPDFEIKSIEIRGKKHNLRRIFDAAKVEYEKKGSQLSDPAKNKLQNLVNLGVTAQNVKDAFREIRKNRLLKIWKVVSIPKYTHLGRTKITIESNGEILYEGSLEPLFTAAINGNAPITFETDLDKLELDDSSALIKLNTLFLNKVFPQKLENALDEENNKKLKELWNRIKPKLKKAKFFNLPNKDKVKINKERYDLQLLFTTVQNSFEYHKQEVSQLTDDKLQAQLQRLVIDGVSGEDFVEALKNWHKQNNDNLNALWNGIKKNLKKLRKQTLVDLLDKLQIKGRVYNFQLLYTAAQTPSEFNKEEVLYLYTNHDVHDVIMATLQSLVNAEVVAGDVLEVLKQQAKEEEENEFWIQLKVILSKNYFINLPNLNRISIRGKNYNLKSLFVAAKDEFNVPGSELRTTDSRAKLRQLLDVGITPFEIEKSLEFLNSERLVNFQRFSDNQPSAVHYLLWLPLFNIQNLTINQMDLTVGQLGSEVAGMLADQKLDFVSFSEEGKQELFSLLNEVGSLSEVVKTAVWKQVQNSDKWKTITGANSTAAIMRIKKLLDEEVVELNIKKVDHPFFPQGYELSFLQDVVTWKDTPLKQLLSGISIRIENNNVIFTSHLFPDQPVLKLPFNKIMSVFDQLTLESIETALQTKVATKLDDYKSSIQINLKNFLQNDIFQIQFNKQNYSIENLIAETNLAKSGSELEGSARKELINLFSGDLNSSILEDILEVRDSVQKKETDQSLLIVLTVVGIVSGIAGVASFAYLFYRKK